MCSTIVELDYHHFADCLADWPPPQRAYELRPSRIALEHSEHGQTPRHLHLHLRQRDPQCSLRRRVQQRFELVLQV